MERRRHSRHGQADPPFEVLLHLPDGRGRLACEVLNISVGGALLRIPRDDALSIPLGSSLTVVITDPESGAGVQVDGVLLHRRTGVHSEQIGLRFDPLGSAEALLHPFMMRRFNRRQNVRVQPADSGVPVWVTVEVPGHPDHLLEHARLADVGLRGMGFVASRAFEEAVVGFAEVECTMRLPGTPLPIVMLGAIEHRALIDDGVRYGVVFMDATTPGQQQGADVVLTYVVRRLREQAEQHAIGHGPAIGIPGLLGS